MYKNALSERSGRQKDFEQAQNSGAPSAFQRVPARPCSSQTECDAFLLRPCRSQGVSARLQTVLARSATFFRTRWEPPGNWLRTVWDRVRSLWEPSERATNRPIICACAQTTGDKSTLLCPTEFAVGSKYGNCVCSKSTTFSVRCQWVSRTSTNMQLQNSAERSSRTHVFPLCFYEFLERV